MDIRVVLTGKTFYEVDPTLVAILTEAFPEQIQRLIPRAEREAIAAAALTPRWAVCQHEVSQIPFITCTIGARVEIFDGNPEHTHEVFAKMGLQCPSEIAERYAALLKKIGRWGKRS